MDWKAFYAEEITAPRGRAAALAALQRHRAGDPRIEAALRAGGIASFPHVSIHDSADPIARVVQTLYRLKAKRVVALGVLHGGCLPAPFREAHAALQDDSPAGARAFAQLGGAFVERGPVETIFGSIDDGPAPAGSPLVRDGPALLRNEFSLDLFLALLAAGGRDLGLRPPAVTRLYIGSTRRPSGEFDTATLLARAIDEIVDEETVCVATGDVVHVGHGYSTPADAAALPADADALAAVLAPRLKAMHEAALARHDFATAWAIGSRLMSDQRHLLPVIAMRLGPGAMDETLSFRLADYSAINGRPAPCFVGAALSVFRTMA